MSSVDKLHYSHYWKVYLLSFGEYGTWEYHLYDKIMEKEVTDLRIIRDIVGYEAS